MEVKIKSKLKTKKKINKTKQNGRGREGVKTYVLLKLNSETAIQTVPNMSNKKSKLVSRLQMPSSVPIKSLKIKLKALIERFFI